MNCAELVERTKSFFQHLQLTSDITMFEKIIDMYGPYWLFMGPVYIASIGFWLFIAFAGYRTFRSARQANHRKLVKWGSIFIAPFALFGTQILWANCREYLRNREVASFQRYDLPSTHPKILEVFGHFMEVEILIYLDTLNLDEVYIFERSHKGAHSNAAVYTLKPHCTGLGAQQLENWIKYRTLDRYSEKIKACVNVERRTVSVERNHIPAIVFQMGHETQSKMQSNTVFGGGNYEARLRIGNQNLLLDYWERPYIQRPRRMFMVWPTGFVDKGNTKATKYKMNRIDFFARAVGLIPREDSKL